MDPKTRAALEWSELSERLAERAVSRAGRARLLTLEPEVTLERALALAERSRDALSLDALGQSLPVSDFTDVTDALDVARRGGTLGVPDLARVLELLGVAHDVRVFAEARRASFPALASAVTSEPRLDRLADRLGQALDSDGSLADAASPELREARERAREARGALKERLEKCLDEHADLVQGRYYTERDGRYALPVRADAHLRVEGIVLGTSASGGTLFVEPRAATELGNRLKLKLAAVEREEQRVLAELTLAVAHDAEAVAGALSAAIEADRLTAIAAFARATRAEVLVPDRSASIDLREVRHPLLAARGVPVVANDVRVEGGQALVISGPNAGGKTVVLKCLGLAVWMARAGIPVPAAPESTIGWFDVIADVGDEQSLERSLSTFSAHVTRLAEIVRSAGTGTLVLLDEVASGTDPEEGAALAAAVLEALTERGAAVAVTTHYERLKELAAAGERLSNASVGFDFARLAPTFELVLGVPGPSSALAVAGRFGLPDGVIERARALLPDRAREREEAVERLGREREALARERSELRGELALARALRADLEAEKALALSQTDQELGREARELLAAVRAARAEIREVRRRLKQGEVGADAVRDVERTVSRAALHVAMGGTLERHAESRKAPARPPEPAALEVGATVRLKRLGTLATVDAEPARGLVRLRAGALRLTVPVTDVEAAPKGARPSTPRREQKKRERPALADAVRTASNTLDLRGVRVDDAIARIDAHLDMMMGEGEPVGFVLTGHGTGAIKATAREHLASSPYVEHSRAAEPDEGGDAFTVFWIRD